MPLTGETPVWPTSSKFVCQWLKTIDRDGYNESVLSFNSHTGTHFDFPFHFVNDGKKSGDIPLDIAIGTAFVIDCQDAESVGADLLESADVPVDCTRLLLKTRNSRIRGAGFCEDYVSLTPDGAEWMVRRGVRLVGIDYLSIDGYRGNNLTHRILLENSLIVLEGLDLGRVVQGSYYLIALPMHIPEAEGAPARAILLEGEPF